MSAKKKKQRELSAFEKKMNDFFIENFTKIKVIDKVFFLEHLNTMLSAGLSLMESLDVLGKEIENEKLKKVIVNGKHYLQNRI